MNAARPTRTRKAFTLIELIAAVVIIGILSGLASPPIAESINKARVVRAISEIRAIAKDLALLDSVPDALTAIGRGGMRDPWGRPYVFYKFPPSRGGGAPPAGARKDRFLVPINSRYDLYSMGANGESRAPLTALPSRDDIVMANDGGFVGLASKF